MQERASDLDVRGLRLHARLRGPGDAPACVLLHGWLDTGASFDRLAPLLHAGHAGPLRTIALDFRGHGDSAWVGAGGFYHFVEYIADLDGALDALGLASADASGAVTAPVRLVGHSMGASVALLYASLRPARVSHAALLDGIPLLVQPSEVPQRLGEYLDDLKKMGRARRVVKSLEQAAERLRKASPLLREDAALALARAGVSPDPAHENQLAWKWDPWLRAHSPLPITAEILQELLPSIRARLLLLRAGTTWLPEEADLRAHFAKLAAPLAVHTLEGTSHHLHLEEPEQVAARILASWSALAR